MTFGQHCSSGVFTMKFHLLRHFLHDLERFVSFSSMDAGPSEHFSMLMKKSHRMTSQRLSTRMYETVANMRRSLDSVQRLSREVYGVASGASLLRKKGRGGWWGVLCA